MPIDTCRNAFDAELVDRYTGNLLAADGGRMVSYVAGLDGVTGSHTCFCSYLWHLTVSDKSICIIALHHGLVFSVSGRQKSSKAMVVGRLGLCCRSTPLVGFRAGKPTLSY